jgi:hypothetical protein
MEPDPKFTNAQLMTGLIVCLIFLLLALASGAFAVRCLWHIMMLGWHLADYLFARRFP